MKSVLIFFLVLILNQVHAQTGGGVEEGDLCELFPTKSMEVNRNNRLQELRKMEGDSVLVQVLNKKGEVSREERGVVSNLSIDVMRRANLHTVLILGSRKKNGKMDRKQYSTTDPSTRIYALDCN
ncbi:MAG: hypothetical protein RIM99_20550 [Cyclobacteriaceae bacterium]